MSKQAFQINGLGDYINFQGALWRYFLPSVGITLKQLYLILSLRSEPLNVPILTRIGFYSCWNNTSTGLNGLIRRGYVVRSGNLYHLTGKGEMIYLQFVDFATKQGAFTDQVAGA